MNELLKLKQQKKILDNKIAEIRKEQEAQNVLSQNEYRELRSLYDDVCDGVIETVKFTVEYEIDVRRCFPGPYYILSSKESKTTNDISVTRTSDRHIADALIDWMEEWDEIPFDISKSKKKELQQMFCGLEKRFKEIAAAKGLDVNDLYDLIPQYKSLKAARKDR